MTSSGFDAHENERPKTKPPARAQRRRFSADFKLKVIQECDAAEHGQVGAVLRRHGTNRTHLRDWRRQYHEGGMAALVGRNTKNGQSGVSRVARLEEANARLETDVEKYKTLAQIAGNAHALLEMLSESADSKTR